HSSIVRIQRKSAEAIPTRWSHNHDSCMDCHTAERPHQSNGRCKRCDDRWRVSRTMAKRDGIDTHETFAHLVQSMEVPPTRSSSTRPSGYSSTPHRRGWRSSSPPCSATSSPSSERGCVQKYDLCTPGDEAAFRAFAPHDPATRVASPPPCQT